MGKPRSRLAFTLVLVLLGFLVVVQWRSQAAGDTLSTLSVQELGELVANLTTRNNQLRAEIAALERQKQSVADAVQRGDTSVVGIRSDLNRILAWSGAQPVTGPGVRVLIAGAIPGDAIAVLINELRNAGAEAIAVGDTRVVPGVVITGPAGSLVIDGLEVPSPIEVRAIGQSDTLAGSLTRVGGLIAQMAAQYPEVTVTVIAADRVDIPATTHDLSPHLGAPRL